MVRVVVRVGVGTGLGENENEGWWWLGGWVAGGVGDGEGYRGGAGGCWREEEAADEAVEGSGD